MEKAILRTVNCYYCMCVCVCVCSLMTAILVVEGRSVVLKDMEGRK